MYIEISLDKGIIFNKQRATLICIITNGSVNTGPVQPFLPLMHFNGPTDILLSLFFSRPWQKFYTPSPPQESIKRRIRETRARISVLSTSGKFLPRFAQRVGKYLFRGGERQRPTCFREAKGKEKFPTA